MSEKGVVRHFLTQIEWREKEIRTITDVIIYHKNAAGLMVPDALHSNNCICPLNLKDHQQRAIIVKMELLYTHNECDTQFLVDVGPVFEGDNTHLEAAHPDKTGIIRFMIPGKRSHGVIDPGMRIIYQPNLVNLGINLLQYAGMENAILEARSTVVSHNGILNSGYMAFMLTDPLIGFLLTHKQHFTALHARDIIKQNDGIYLVRTPLVIQVQDFFRDTIFPHLKYTTVKNLPLKCHFLGHQCPDTLMVMVSTDYMIVSPQIPTYKTKDIKLNI